MPPIDEVLPGGFALNHQFGQPRMIGGREMPRELHIDGIGIVWLIVAGADWLVAKGKRIVVSFCGQCGFAIFYALHSFLATSWA
jgi:hypothetical protein